MVEVLSKHVRSTLAKCIKSEILGVFFKVHLNTDIAFKAK